MQGLDLENIEVIEEPFSPFNSLIQDKNQTTTPENIEGEETVETPDINPDNIFGDSEDTSENLDNEDVKKTTPFGVFANALVEEVVFTSSTHGSFVSSQTDKSSCDSLYFIVYILPF